ncbi:MAG TPA: hypothetical protein VJ810_19060 [Blastocatellia bacterium]|nr:hypothetical protein [Blastocatellia bacterium]
MRDYSITEWEASPIPLGGSSQSANQLAASDVSGRYEIYVQSFPIGGGQQQVSTGRGAEITPATEPGKPSTQHERSLAQAWLYSELSRGV